MFHIFLFIRGFILQLVGFLRTFSATFATLRINEENMGPWLSALDLLGATSLTSHLCGLMSILVLLEEHQ